MRDSQLLLLVKQRHALHTRKKSTEEMLDELDTKILGELVRREATSVPVEGFSVTRTSRRLGYQLEPLKEQLTAGRLRLITTTCVDSAAVQREVKAGRIPAELAETAERRSAEYLVVTVTERKAEAA